MTKNAFIPMTMKLLAIIWVAVAIWWNSDQTDAFSLRSNRLKHYMSTSSMLISCSMCRMNMHLHDEEQSHERPDGGRRMFLDDTGRLIFAMMGSSVCTIAAPSSAWSTINSDTSPSSSDISSTELQLTKPFAPPEALVPAVRVQFTIDRCLTLAEDIQQHPNDNQNNYKRQTDLQKLLLVPQNYVQTDFLSSSSSDFSHHRRQMVGFLPMLLNSNTNIPLPGAGTKYQPAKAYMDTYDRNRQDLPVLLQPGALLVQSGEIDSWRRLKRQEAEKESQDEIRAALNTYTQALTYRGDAYVLTVSTQERSRMVRENKLPDVKQVIASDLGMRYLYRNQLLTIMAEVKAELQYQLKQQQQQQQEQEQNKVSSIDVSDLVPLLRDAQVACQQWFSLIEQDQVEAAVNLARQEDSKVML